MLFARIRPILTSFRFRVMAWLFLVVTAMMLLTTVVVGAIVNRSIHQEFDRQLNEEADETILAIRELFPNPFVENWRASYPFEDLKHVLERRARSRGYNRWFIRLYDEDEQPIYQSESPSGIPTPRGSETGRQIRDSGAFRWIQATFPPEKADAQLWIQIGRSRVGMQEDVSLLNFTLLLRALLVLVLAPLGGYFLARQVTGPLTNIINTASRLQPQQFSERLPIRGTGDELDQVSQTINGMLDRIAAFIEQNRTFVANAAHELRSPLAAIRSSVEVALNRPRTSEEYTTVLAEMMEEVSSLSAMVNRLLILAEGDAGRLNNYANQSASLDKVVREAVDMFHAVAESEGVELKVTHMASVDVPGDEQLLRHLVRNLIDNAIKFSEPNSSVEVDLRTDPERQRATLAVSDQGIGIPPDDLPKLFQRFFRGDKSRHRDHSRAGSGLGLSICRTIVDSLKGEIGVVSDLGKGSTFTVRLPLARGS